LQNCVLPVFVVLLAACGDKVPESKAAKEVGNAPKQTVDKAAAGVSDAMQKAAGRVNDQDEKKQ
jgi:hypothetical protein